MLGSEVVKQASESGKWMVLNPFESGYSRIDITDRALLKEALGKIKPDAVVNCAAYTNVDQCEEPEGFKIAEMVNGYAVGYIAEQCLRHNIDFLHISSDYVFGDNRKEGYTEDYNLFRPLNKYGETKLLGEQELTKHAGGIVNGSDFKVKSPGLFVVRTSWLFGKGAKNFISKILELAQTRDHLEVVTDEVSSPTYVKDLALAVLEILGGEYSSGIFHVSGKGACFRFDFAKEILMLKNVKIEIRPTELAKFERKARIANFSYLVNTKLPEMRSWKEMLKDYFSDN